jgi:hypothetical protein
MGKGCRNVDWRNVATLRDKLNISMLYTNTNFSAAQQVALAAFTGRMIGDIFLWYVATVEFQII